MPSSSIRGTVLQDVREAPLGGPLPLEGPRAGAAGETGAKARGLRCWGRCSSSPGVSEALGWGGPRLLLLLYLLLLLLLLLVLLMLLLLL